MNTLLTFAISIDPQMIKMGFNILFFAIIASVLIGGIVGMVRGVFNSGYRLLFMGVLVLLCYFFTNDIAKIIANIDIGSMLGGMSVNIGKESVSITSIEKTISDVLQALSNSNENLSGAFNTSSEALLKEIVMMVVRFITFIILGIFVATIGNFLSMLTYHLIFKLFIPKKTRKKVKLRLLSFAFGAIKSIMVGSLLIVPFTAFLNTINQSVKKVDNAATIDNAMYNQIMEWINAYDDSLLAQVLFNWNADENGKTFDISLVNFATSDGKDSLVFMNELGVITDLAATVFGSGAITDQSVDISLLLTDTVVNAIIESLLRSDLVKTALPLVAAFALNMQEIEEYIDASKINLDDIDWENELKIVQGIANDINELGIINFDDILNNNFDATARNLFAKGNKEGVISLFKSLDNSSILSQVIPAVLYRLANQSIAVKDGDKLYDISLPKDWESYRQIKIGNEFAILYSSIFDINAATDNALLDELAPIKDEEQTAPLERVIRFNALTNEAIEEEEPEKKKDTLDIILEYAEKVLPAIVGKVDNDGEPIVDENGLSLSEDGTCLLDSHFINLTMNPILNTLLKALSDSIDDYELPQEDIDEITEELNGRKAYKRELNVLLDIVSKILNDPNLKGVQDGKLDVNDDSVRSLKGILPKIDNSKLMTRVLPDVLEVSLKTFDEDLKEYDLTTADFDFRVDKFGSELAALLDVYQSMDRLNNAFAKESTGEIIKSIEPNDVKSLLDTMYVSKILNPNKGVENKNFYKTLDAIFNFEGLEITGITSRVPNIENVQWLDYEEGGQPMQGENSRLANFFAELKNDDIIAMISNDNLEIHDPNSLNPDGLRGLFDRVDESKVMSQGFGSVLDRVLLNSINTENLDITFNNVSDWKSEGDSLIAALKGMQMINKSIDNIKWINENPLYLNDILSAFSESQLFVDKNSKESKFDEFVFANMKATIPDYLKDYRSGDSEETRTFVVAQNDFESVEQWKPEIDSITEIIRTIQSFAPEHSTAPGSDGLNALKDSSTSASEMETMLLVLNESTSFRMVFVNILDSSLTDDSMSIGNMSLDESNVPVIIPMDKQERDIEIVYLVEMYTKIEDMDLKNGFALATIEGEEIKHLLDAIYKSKIFNTFKNQNQELTVFEQTIQMIIKESGFENKILESNQTLVEKIQTISNDYAGTQNDKNDEWTIEDGENTKIGELISSYKDTGVVDFEMTSSELEDLMSTDEKIDLFGNLLNSINNSRIFYKGLPAVLDESLEKDLIEVAGLNLNSDLVNTDYNNGLAYESLEITKMMNVMKSFNRLNDVKDISGNKIDNPTLIDYDLDVLEETLNGTHDSKVLNTVKGTIRQQTFFENIVASIVIKAEIDQRITSQTRTFDSIIFGIGNSVVDIQETDGWVGPYQEISRIVDLLEEFKVIGIDDGDIAAKNNWTQDEVSNTLFALNNSRICYRSIPSYMDELIDNRQVDGVDLMAANTAYNGDTKYDDGEIDVISQIYVSLDESSELIEKLQDISSLSDDEIDRIKLMLNNLAISQVFHISGSDVADKTTVFEQTIEKLLVDSTLDNLAHDVAIFNEDLTQTPVEKAQKNIVTYSNVVAADTPLLTWEKEIECLFNTIEILRDNTTITTIDTVNPAEFSPSLVSELLNSLAESELVYDAVPSQIKQIFDDIGFAAFADGHEDYLLTASSNSYRDEYLNREIDTLVKLLNGSYDDANEKYIDFDAPGFDIIDLINQNFKMESIVAYLSHSFIFYDCRGLTLKNTINSAGYSNYIRNEYDVAHKNVFDEIFSIIENNDNQISFEGLALDSMITSLKGFVGTTFKNLDGDGISNLYRTVFDGYGSIGMIASEILFGFIGDSLYNSGYVADGYIHEWFKDENSIDFIYPRANEKEARGIKGAIELINFGDITFGNPSSITNGVIANISQSFALLEYNGENSIIASSIYFKGFYSPFTNSLAMVRTNADIVFGIDQVNKDLFVSSYDALKDDPFEIGFSFLVEGAHVTNVLTAFASTAV